MDLDCGDGRSGGGVDRGVGALIGVVTLSVVAAAGGARVLLLRRLNHLPWAHTGEGGGAVLAKDVVGDGCCCRCCPWCCCQWALA